MNNADYFRPKGVQKGIILWNVANMAAGLVVFDSLSLTKYQSATSMCPI